MQLVWIASGDHVDVVWLRWRAGRSVLDCHAALSREPRPCLRVRILFSSPEYGRGRTLAAVSRGRCPVAPQLC